MTEKEYSIVATEVLEILKHFRKEDIEKISPKFIEFLEAKKDSKYNPNFNFSNCAITEIPMKKETKAMLGMIYRSYWCNEDERKEYDKILIENSKKKNEKLRQRYNPDEIFKKDIKVEIESNTEIKDKLPLDYSNISWYKKLYIKFMAFIKKNRRKKND